VSRARWSHSRPGSGHDLIPKLAGSHWEPPLCFRPEKSSQGPGFRSPLRPHFRHDGLNDGLQSAQRALKAAHARCGNPTQHEIHIPQPIAHIGVQKNPFSHGASPGDSPHQGRGMEGPQRGLMAQESQLNPGSQGDKLKGRRSP
jgi:hypothetical protein